MKMILDFGFWIWDWHRPVAVPRTTVEELEPNALQSKIQNPKSKIALALLFSALLPLSGCQIGELIGAGMAADEYQKLVDTPPQYTGLQANTVAVVVQADYSVLYEHRSVVPAIAANISRRIQTNVPGAQVLNAQHVINWQYRTPQWNALPYGEIAEQLNVDRVVMIDLLEYRLHPPGNAWLWEGVCTARIGVIERGGISADEFANVFDISVSFPNVTGVAKDAANATQIETGLLAKFVEKTAWLFYQHLEPKYPDRYRPELERK